MSLTHQQRIVLDRLKTGNWLTTVQAIQELYIIRLGARIHELRQKGYEIESAIVPGTPYGRYRLKNLPSPSVRPLSEKKLEEIKAEEQKLF